MKEFTRKHFPRLFASARRAKDQLVIEARVLRQVGLRVIVDRFVSSDGKWEGELPIQIPRHVRVETGFSKPQEVLNWARNAGLPVAEGAHTIYLPPATFRASPFRLLADQYPANAGMKLAKNLGSCATGEYVHGTNHSALHRKITYSHRHLSLVAAALYLHDLGPRLYDLIEIGAGQNVWTAYIVSHCEGRVPLERECIGGLDRLRALEKSGLLKVIAPGGFAHSDFVPPNCGGNCLIDRESGEFQYLDFQNFVMPGYGRFLEQVALAASEHSHFGDRSVLRGGRYLYQSIPGVGLPAKRHIDVRAAAVKLLLDRSGLSVEGKLVLDIGCNLGMAMAQYLAWGARWCHGWDRSAVVPHAERVLLAIGCTRFTVTGAELTRDRQLETDIPSFLERGLDGSVVSYLAVRGHIGWLDALPKLPWAFMIYEGHENEESEFERHMKELCALTGCEVRACDVYQDGDSLPRNVAVLARVK